MVNDTVSSLVMAMAATTSGPLNATVLPTNQTAMVSGISQEEEEQIQMIVSRIVPIFFGLIGITGLLGNALVVLVVVSNPMMRSTTNLLIINLAVADLLFVIFCIPFTATDYVLSSWPFGDWWCKCVQYLIVVTAHASIYTLVLMSLDRFLAVVHPIASMVIRTEKNTVWAITVLWVVIVTTAIPVCFSHGVNVSRKWTVSGTRMKYHASPL